MYIDLDIKFSVKFSVKFNMSLCWRWCIYGRGPISFCNTQKYKVYDPFNNLHYCINNIILYYEISPNWKLYSLYFFPYNSKSCGAIFKKLTFLKNWDQNASKPPPPIKGAAREGPNSYRNIDTQNGKNRHFGPYPAAPLMGGGKGGGGVFDVFWSQFFKNVHFLKIAPQLFEL